MGNKYQWDVMRGQSKISGVRCRMSVFSILHSLRSSYVWRKHSKGIINGLLEVTVFECCKNSAFLSILVILEHILVMLCLEKDIYIYNRMDLCSLFVSFWLCGVFHRRRHHIHHLEAVYEQDSDSPKILQTGPRVCTLQMWCDYGVTLIRSDINTLGNRG